MSTTPSPSAAGRPRSRPAPVLAGLGVWLLAAMVVSPAAAQQPVYRTVGPDGRVTFTDRPPAAPGELRPATPVPPTGPATAGLPPDLAAVVSRFPVQLYTGPGCATCDEARALLRRRGVPYRERTVVSARDVAELERLTRDRVLPSLLVGRQPVAGFRAVEWGGWLDAAGYPSVSRLPPGWRPPEPLPLTVSPANVRAASDALPAPTPVPAPSPGPGGIRF